MSVLLESVNRINSLKSGIEAVTGETYPDLTEGVQALKDGYGQGGGGDETFVGIKLSEFNYRYAPLVADMRTLPVDGTFGGFTYLFCNQSTAGNGGFYAHLRDIYLPQGIKSFDVAMFSNCGALKNLHGDCSEIGAIQMNAFNNCGALTELPYMPNLSYIANYCLGGSGVTEFRLYKKPTFQANAFGNSNITNIYVPWAEGEVTGAPWGAVKATIHYNTTYDENHDPIVAEV